MMSHHLVVMSLLVLIVGQVIEELVVELSWFSNELSLWDGQHQSVHFFLKLSVLVEHEGCHAEHHSNGDTNCDCD